MCEENEPTEANVPQKNPRKWTLKEKYADMYITLLSFQPELQPPFVLDTATAAKYAKLLRVTPEKFALLLDLTRRDEGEALTASRIKGLVEFNVCTDAGKFIKQSSEALDFEEYGKALQFSNEAVVRLRELMEAGLVVESVQRSADAFCECGRALSRLCRHTEAIASFDEALALEKRLRDERRDAEYSLGHADTFMNKALALTNAGRQAEGTDCYQTALTVYRRGWENHNESAGGRLALVLFNLGESEQRAGRFREAVTRYDEALAIHRECFTDKSVDTGSILTKKSQALYKLDEFDSALLAAQDAVAILEPLTGNEAVKFDLSAAILWRGRALERLYRVAEASECYWHSTELVREVKRKRAGARN